MIYAGFLNFNDSPDRLYELCSAFCLDMHAHPPTVIRKNTLTLCWRKRSNGQDMDEVWENTSSVSIGRIFDKAQNCPFSKKDYEDLSGMNKDEVLEKVWGKYVYIQSDNGGKRFEIVVDSTGQLPFFYYPFADGNILFSSDIEIIFKSLRQKAEYNWTYLCSYLLYGNSCAIQTPFDNIYELPPGCCLEATKSDIKTQPFWDPLRPYGKRTIFQDKDSVGVLQDTLKLLIQPYKNICVSLSGGLDSSSLTYCLNSIKREDQVLTALNYFHASVKPSNELLYARQVCQETDIKLFEIESSSFLPFDLPLKKQPIAPNKPFPGLVGLRCLEILSDHIPAGDPCLFLSGHGSDHIFMCPPARKSVADYFLEKGLKGAKEKLIEIAHFYRDSAFSVFSENVRGLISYWLSRRLEKRHSKSIQYKTPDWIKQRLHQQASPAFVHPIYGCLPYRIPPGKYMQIDAFYEGLASIHMEMDSTNPTCYPFLYEPVVEFALSFPSYELFSNGYDRHPLRKSVSDHFKTKNVWRRDKGETSGMLQLGLKKNLARILDLCLEGEFSKQDLVDRDGLYRTIMAINNGNAEHLWPFMHIVSIEIFLNFWREK